MQLKPSSDMVKWFLCMWLIAAVEAGASAGANVGMGENVNYEPTAVPEPGKSEYNEKAYQYVRTESFSGYTVGSNNWYMTTGPNSGYIVDGKPTNAPLVKGERATAKSSGSGQTYIQPGQCDVTDPTSCNRKLYEVCNLENNVYKCGCPTNHTRLPDGRCLIINECVDRKLHDCHDDAKCTDTQESYICECNPGFVDMSPETSKPGRLCKKITDECKDPTTYKVDCDTNAYCKDTPDSFECICKTGYYDVSERYGLKAGRKCEIGTDPCKTEKNDCSPFASCISQKGAYTCQCKSGYTDISPNKFYPGRDCRPIGPEYAVTAAPCDPKKDKSCPTTETKDLCSSKTECDPNANCISKTGSYDCQCKAGYTDVSPDDKKRGRKCVLPEDRCANRDRNDCSVFGNCFPSKDSYTCECMKGFLDVSSQHKKPPGRVCIREKDACSNPNENSCSDNSDCIKKPDGYACLCWPNYFDQSSNAKLPPGRLCTLQTACPTQPTDLIFVVDGSGSIGTTDFKEEILRFISEFVKFFTIAPDQTRVGVVQYSDIIKKEFDLDQYTDEASLEKAIKNIQYMEGLTSTGKALNFTRTDGFSASHGARMGNKAVHQIAIVITDGRAQDDVKTPADAARNAGILLFAVGVTDHIQESQLEEIAGDKKRVFIVHTFTELNYKLRAMIQLQMCPLVEKNATVPLCPGCDPSRNYVCKDDRCVCPPGFCEDPVHKICGSQPCNPELEQVTCPFPQVCKETPFKNFRCACPSDQSCGLQDGTCVNRTVVCPENEKMNPYTNKCEGCNPACDINKNQHCIKNQNGELECKCKPRYTLDPITNVCTIDECKVPGMTKCSKYANCTDTLEGYFCVCFPGYKDESPPGKQGEICIEIKDPCKDKTNDCPKGSECIRDSQGGFTCKCPEGFVDMYPPKPGYSCINLENECLNATRNNCSVNATCYDLQVGYKCICNDKYVDLKPYIDPGRFCAIDPCQDPNINDCWLKRCKVIDIAKGLYECEACPNGYKDMDPKHPGRKCETKVPPCADRNGNTCDPNAYCLGVPGKPDDYTCRCRDGYLDMSATSTNASLNLPGQVCVLITNYCFDATKNDCDLNAICRNLGENKFNCTCMEGFIDKSPDPKKPGRVCQKLVNECLIPQLNNCSMYATCKDLVIGYACICNEGYKDKSPEGFPGRICEQIIKPCSSISLNECDVHARCTPIGDSDYNCTCVPPYIDASTSPPFGRKCKYDGCADKRINTCSINATCVNMEGFVNCICKENMVDVDTTKPGSICEEERKCGSVKCNKALGLVCDEKNKVCTCKPGFMQRNATSKCVEVKCVDLYLWVVRNHTINLNFTNEYTDVSNPKTQVFTQTFINGVGNTYDVTALSTSYVTTTIREIQSPNKRNPNWDHGLWVEFTSCFEKTTAPTDYQAWRILVDTSRKIFNYELDSSRIFINEYQLPFACYKNDCDKNAECLELTPTSFTCRCNLGFEDADENNPGKKCMIVTTAPTTQITRCGDLICKKIAGEVCVDNTCVCEQGKSRIDPNDECVKYDRLVCIDVVIYKNASANLIFNSGQNDLSSSEYMKLIPNYIRSIDSAYQSTEVYTNIVGITASNVTKATDAYPGYKGIKIKTCIAVVKITNDKEICEQFMKSIRSTNFYLGVYPLKADEDFDVCNPKFKCGSVICKPEEFCVNNKCSECPEGQYMDKGAKVCKKLISCGGVTCKPGQFCVDGKCSDCPEGKYMPPGIDKSSGESDKVMSDKCVDIITCGSVKCKPGEFCVDGKCSPCPKGQEMKEGKCIEITTIECGGVRCKPEEGFCIDNKCSVCPKNFIMKPGQTKCEEGTLCDGVVCKANETCVDNKCSVCPKNQVMYPGSTKCENSIVTTTESGKLCGDGTCPPEKFCIDGKCSECPKGKYMKPGQKECIDIIKCGSETCKPEEFCVDGKCSTCPKGQFMKPGQTECKDLTECEGVLCKPDEPYCVDGKCSKCPKDKYMKPGQTECIDIEKCGSEVCKPEEFCVDGKCSKCPKDKYMKPGQTECIDVVKCGSETCKPEEFCVDGKCSKCPKGQYMKPGQTECIDLIKCGDETCKPEEFCVDGKCSKCPKGQFMKPGQTECKDLTECDGVLCKPDEPFCVDGKCSKCPKGQYMPPNATKCEPLVECGGKTCKPGQFCVNGKCSKCPEGQYPNKQDVCEDVDICEVVLLLDKKNEEQLTYTENFDKPDSTERKEIENYLTEGMPNVYDKQGLKENLITIEIKSISKPPDGKPGLLAEFSAIFKKDKLPNSKDCLARVITTIIEQFNYSVGGTPIFISREFPACAFSKTSPCKKCPSDTLDLAPMLPGTNCTKDFCANHNCPKEAICIATNPFSCKCKKGYVDNSTNPNHAGRKCYYNFCLDFPYCTSANGTCVNYQTYASCECNKTYIDLRPQPKGVKRICHGDAFCLLKQDIDYCCMEMHKCHVSALCKRKKVGGYQCTCPDGSVVADNEICEAGKNTEPVSVSREKRNARGPSCLKCASGGHCTIYESDTETVCECATWYTGEACTVDIRLVLLEITVGFFLLAVLSTSIWWFFKKQRTSKECCEEADGSRKPT